MPGDLVLVRPQTHGAPGDVVVALLGEDATVKRLSIAEGTPMLTPENPAYQPIRGEFRIIGRVLGTIRAYEEVVAWA